MTNTLNSADTKPTEVAVPAVTGQSKPDQPSVSPPGKSAHDIEQATDQTFREINEWMELLAVEDYETPALQEKWPANEMLSIVVPVYNEEATIATVLGRLRSLPVPKEIVVVDDFSTDGTREILRKVAECPEIHVIYKPENEGKGAALRDGFKRASGRWVAIQDADLEYDPRDLLPLLGPLIRNEADVVYGSRFLAGAPHDPSFIHRFGNGLLTFASNVTTGLRLTDMETCYKVFRRDLLDGLSLRQNRFGFEPEITAKLARRRARFTELPVNYQPRGYDEGKKIGLRDLFNAVWCILRFGWWD